MSTAGGYGPALSGALKDLNIFWDRTASSWNDGARDKFAKDHIDDLAHAIRDASTALDQIEQLLRQIRRECS